MRYIDNDSSIIYMHFCLTCNRYSTLMLKSLKLALNFNEISGAVQRWVLAQPGKAAISEKCETMAGLGSKDEEPGNPSNAA